MISSLNVTVFTTNGIWIKPQNLLFMRVIVRGPGGNGTADRGGGGGGLVLSQDRLDPTLVPDVVAITVGTPGIASKFGELFTSPSGATGGDGAGYGVLAGGNGGGAGGVGASSSGLVVRLLAGGGGGGGAGAGGGASGMNRGGAVGSPGVQPDFWQVCQSGSGGGAGGAGGYPSGGGGAGAAGAAGCVTILEHLLILEE